MLWVLTSLWLAGAPTAEGSHAAVDYYAARAGSSWSYIAGKDKVSIKVSGIENFKSKVQIDWGGRSTAGRWLLKEGVWLERLNGISETVVLPAALHLGAQWSGPSSLARNGKDASTYEVVTTDATIEVPAGTFDRCLAVLETARSGVVLTHYWAPNVGRVAVKSNDDFVLKLVAFEPGRRVGAD